MEYSDDDNYGQFYMLDEIEYNNTIRQARKDKLSDPRIDLLHINYSSTNNRPVQHILVGVAWCVGLICIGIASYCIVFIYYIQQL